MVGDQGAIHFHFVIYKNKEANEIIKDCDMEYAPGLEIHYRNCPDYMNPKEPSQEHCWLLDAPCWHDGSSLYACEFVMPNLIRRGVDWLWEFLEERYKEEFEVES